MAGTRLLIQGTFVAEFFLLVLTALYFGLYKTADPISFHLPHYQQGRSLLREALRELDRDQSQLGVPAVRIATTKENARLLERLIGGDTLGLLFQVVVEEDMSACRQVNESEDDATNSIGKKYSVWFCPPGMRQQEEKSPSVVVRNGATFLFPDAPETVDSLFQHLISSSSPNRTGPPRRKPLQFSVMMEHRHDWDPWAKALSKWIHKKEALGSWRPCIRGEIQSGVALSTLVEQTSTTKGTERRISTKSMKKSVIDRQADPNVWNVILYLPRVSPAQFIDSNGRLSQAMYVDNTLVSTINHPEVQIGEESISSIDDHGNETITVKATTEPVPVEDLVEQAMASIDEFLLHQCMGVQATRSDDSDTSLPLWQLEVWIQRVLTETYQHARAEIVQEGEWLLQSTTWVVIDNRVAAHWQTLIQWMQEAKTIASQSDNGYSRYLEALAILEESLEYLQAVRTAPSLMEPLRFSLPQFMAIFAPLCLPLFLPHLIGLIREYKRYKNLRDGK